MNRRRKSGFFGVINMLANGAVNAFGEGAAAPAPYKVLFLNMAPDGDPEKHRGAVKSAMIEVNTVVVKNEAQAVTLAKDMVQKEGIESIVLCPGFSNEGVGKVTEAVGQAVAVFIARGDPRSNMVTSKHFMEKNWFSEKP